MSDVMIGRQPSERLQNRSPEKQLHHVFEVVLINGYLTKCKSDMKMNEGEILKWDGRRMYYRELYTTKEEINVILSRVNFDKNYCYLSYEINKIFLELLKGRISEKQQVFMWLKRRNGTLKEYGPFPGGCEKHSEDYILEILLDKQFNDWNYVECWIYSTNSPCLGKYNRELKDHNPCMINIYTWILNKSHNIKTYVGFSRFYGISGSYKKLLPHNPFKQNNFPKNEKHINQKFKRIDMLKDFNQEFFNLSNKLITELKDKKFEIKEGLCNKNGLSLQNEIPVMWKDSVKRELKVLFQYTKYPATFDQFMAKGWKKLADFRNKLSTIFDIHLNSNVQLSFFKKVEDIFLDWWDQIVKNASSTFLNEILEEYLKMYTFLHFRNEIPDTHKNFIGCIRHN